MPSNISKPTNDVIDVLESALDDRDAEIRRLAALAGPRVFRTDEVPGGWPIKPVEFDYPIHKAILLDGVEQEFPWDQIGRDAPAGTRILIAGARNLNGQVVNVRPTINDSVRWSRRFDGTIFHFKNLVLRPEGDSAFFQYGEELDVILDKCVVRGDYGDNRDSANSARTGFFAAVDTTFNGVAFGLRGTDYAARCNLHLISDDAIQSSAHVEDIEVVDLTRVNSAHPDVLEVKDAVGYRWNNVRARRFDGQGFAATTMRDAYILNCVFIPDSDYDAYTLGVGYAEDFHWWGGLLEGRLRAPKTSGVVEFVATQFRSPETQINSMIREGVRFIGCHNYGIRIPDWTP